MLCSFDMMTDEDKEATIKMEGVCFSLGLCEHVQEAERTMARKQGGKAWEGTQAQGESVRTRWGVHIFGQTTVRSVKKVGL